MRLVLCVVLLALLLAPQHTEAASVKKAWKKVKQSVLDAVASFKKTEKPGDVLPATVVKEEEQVVKENTKKEQQQKPKPATAPVIPALMPFKDGDENKVKAPAYRKAVFAAVPAGASMGNKADIYYWTPGAIMCDKDGNKYGLTNKHNEAGLGNGAVVTQPSKNGDDHVKSASVAVDVGKWTSTIVAEPMDLAVFKFDDKAKGVAKVLGKAGALHDQAGMVPISELKTWATDGSKVLYLSGRMCGWCGVQFQSIGPHVFGFPGDYWVCVNPNSVVDSEANTILTPGNSGSGLWDLGSDGKVRLVAIFNGDMCMPAAEQCIADVKTAGLDLSVCTP